MKKIPLISIIVPVYNTEAYLTKCMESLCSQSLKNIEIVCVDDASEDSSLEILKEFQSKDKRIKIITQEHKGVAAARNAGLDNAIGKYIAFVDSDDFISPYMFEKLYNKINEYKTDIVICNYFLMYVDSVGPRSEKPSYLIESEKEYLYDLLKDDNIQNYLWSRLYKRKLFNNLRFKEGKIFEDIYLTTDLIGRIKKAYYTNEPLYCYRMRKDSITNSLDISGVDDAIDCYYKRYCKIIKLYPDLLNIGVYSMLRWISIIIDAYDKEKMNYIIKKYDDVIGSVIEELKNTSIDEFKDDTYKYKDVLELIDKYNKLHDR